MKKILTILLAIILSAKLSYAQVSQGDFDALVALYNATGGLNWTNKTGWSTTVNNVSNSWYGITISGGRVVEIDLSYNNLSGEIPVEIGNLTALKKLNARNNGISKLPKEIGNLNILEYLMLNYNAITTIPDEISKLSALTEFEIGKNNLETVPSEVYSLTGLKTLNIGFNQLTYVSPNIGNLTNLTTLFLNGNELTSIPTEIGNLTKLRYLYLRENKLTSIPSTIGNLSELYELHINNNQLESLPTEIGDLSSLNWLYLNNNYLTEIPVEVNKLTTITRLVIDHNELSSFPDISAINNLGMLYVDYNHLNFSDLKNSNLDWSSIFYQQYSPQSKIVTNGEEYGSIGEPVNLFVTDSATKNLYKWYKDGIEINNSNNDTLNIASYKIENNGIYICKITNPDFPGLILESEPIHLMLTGINDLGNKNQTIIFPNPSNGNFIIGFDKLPNQNCYFEIIDMSGKKIHRQKLIRNNQTINLAAVAQGTFVVQIVDNKQIYSSCKIIITK